MKTPFVPIMLVIAALIVGIPLACFSWQLLAIRYREKTLLKPEVYESVARILVDGCQSTTSDVPVEISSAAFPSELKCLDRLRGVYVSHQFGSVDFGGGFYGYGYQLNRYPLATLGNADRWMLRIYSSTKSYNKLLCYIERDKTTGFTVVYDPQGTGSFYRPDVTSTKIPNITVRLPDDRFAGILTNKVQE